MAGQRDKARDYAKIKIEGHSDLYEYKRMYAAERRKTPEYKAWQKEYNKKYREANKEKLTEANKEYRRNNKARTNHKNREAAARLKLEVFKHYCDGEDIKCAACGFSDIRALDLDHINNDGADHRRDHLGRRTACGGSTYSWLKRNNYPSGFQVLCRNCNWIKEIERRPEAIVPAHEDKRAAAMAARKNTESGWVARQSRGVKCQK